MGTIIVGAILLCALVLVIRSMIQDKKAGKSLHCGGECRQCNGNCHLDL